MIAQTIEDPSREQRMKLREKGESSSFERIKNNSRVFAFVAKLGRLQAVHLRKRERERAIK